MKGFPANPFAPQAGYVPTEPAPPKPMLAPKIAGVLRARFAACYAARGNGAEACVKQADALIDALIARHAEYESEFQARTADGTAVLVKHLPTEPQ